MNKIYNQLPSYIAYSLTILNLNLPVELSLYYFNNSEGDGLTCFNRVFLKTAIPDRLIPQNLHLGSRVTCVLDKIFQSYCGQNNFCSLIQNIYCRII